jgi:endonuclease/exonuclease/phosphatase family metal-dependent hydrolase
MRFLLITLLLLLTLPVRASDRADVCEALNDVITDQHIRLATLNLAHGRGLGLNQLLQRASVTRQNLSRVSSLLLEIDADMVALQEADAPSWWSGEFDHVELLATEAGYPCYEHGVHAVTRMYAFGTALLSRTRFHDVLTHGFVPSPPTTNKGFVLGEFKWNPGGMLAEPLIVDVISVHLDFSRRKVRESQIAEMREQLEKLTPPVVILGDFNSDWQQDGSVLKQIAEQAGLVAWQPESEDLGTYNGGDKRLDWILISQDLEFESYEVAAQEVSDHRAVVADIALKPSPEGNLSPVQAAPAPAH